MQKEVEFRKVFSKQDVEAFAKISLDDNPIHLDEEFAKKSIFGKTVVHGILITSMFSKIFGTVYPGIGTIYLSQASKFLRPAYVGDEITAKVELTSYDDVKRRGIFKTECFNSSQELILTGEAKIIFPKDVEPQ